MRLWERDFKLAAAAPPAWALPVPECIVGDGDLPVSKARPAHTAACGAFAALRAAGRFAVRHGALAVLQGRPGRAGAATVLFWTLLVANELRGALLAFQVLSALFR